MEEAINTALEAQIRELEAQTREESAQANALEDKIELILAHLHLIRDYNAENGIPFDWIDQLIEVPSKTFAEPWLKNAAPWIMI